MTPPPSKKDQQTETHWDAYSYKPQLNHFYVPWYVYMYVFTIIFIYLYNMDSVSSTGDRDVQPAAVDDWPQEPSRRLRTPVHV